MNAKDAIRICATTADMICLGYLEDLSDADLMKRAAPGINTINWQIGHLILSEHNMLSEAFPGAMPSLPAGFADQYSRETVSKDTAADFLKKAELIEAHKTQRAATLAQLDKVSDADLDKESPEQIRSYAATLGALFMLPGEHWLMHCGQWVVVRRQLGRPPLF
jgi:hypothetical protein